MTRHKTHYTAKELAGLPGMPTTERGVQKKAANDAWPSRPRQGKGGGREYPVTALPQETRDYLLDQYIAKHPAKACALPVAKEAAPLAKVEETKLPDLAGLKHWQIKAMDARLVFIRLIEQAKATHGVKRAIAVIVEKAASGKLPESIQPLVAVANQRSGKDNRHRTLSERSLLRWWSDYQAAGGKYAVLAPKDVEKRDLPPWATAFLAEYRKPQKPSPADALAALKNSLPAGIPVPTIHQVRNFIKKYSKLDIQRGRKSGPELRSQRSYIERDTSQFQPGDICLCDGHSFKAKVAHPVHGRPFHPEVCAVVDATTRIVWGWSAGLAESSFTVADAIRDAVTVREGKPACIPAILYTDNGAGNTSAANADDITGLFPRLGITFETGRAGNPQGRGRVERLQASLWIRAAKELPTYTGKSMDALAKRNVHLTLDKDVREARKTGGLIKSDLLISWPDFLTYCDQVVYEYNRRPHSALPKIRCQETGLKRHMSPMEYLAQFIAQGWQPELPKAEELTHLFRPQVQVTARRGNVTVFGNTYHNADLEHYQGELVNVAYDIHDASQVWVRDWEQRLICTAKFEGNKRAFFAVPKVDQAREQRRQRRTKTLERHLEEVQLEAQAPIEIPIAIHIAPEIVHTSERIMRGAEQKRKLVSNSWERYEDIREREKTIGISDYERQWAADFDAFTASGKKSKLLRNDEFCTGGQAAIAAQG